MAQVRVRTTLIGAGDNIDLIRWKMEEALNVSDNNLKPDSVEISCCSSLFSVQIDLEWIRHFENGNSEAHQWGLKTRDNMVDLLIKADLVVSWRHVFVDEVIPDQDKPRPYSLSLSFCTDGRDKKQAQQVLERFNQLLAERGVEAKLKHNMITCVISWTDLLSNQASGFQLARQLVSQVRRSGNPNLKILLFPSFEAEELKGDKK